MYEEYRERIETWLAGTLGDPSRRDWSPKEINDPVWGTISIDSFEHGVIDSPILQRLRRIRQLGVSHFVFPAANHTRFDHSVGVMHAVGEMLTAARGELIPPELQRVMRLVGLMHDVGHGAMSHVSEKALMELREIQDLVFAAYDFIGVTDLKLGEIASWTIVASESFYRYISDLDRVTNTNPRLPSNWQEIACNVIAGKPAARGWPLLQQIVSGPFDADKLDYIARDSAFCGLPPVVDKSRLLHKLRSVSCDANDLPPGLAQFIDTDDRPTIVGVATSADRSIDEMAVARTLLHDKVYRHQKGRAAESVVACLYRRIHSVGVSAIELAVRSLTLPDEALLDPLALSRAFGLDALAEDTVIRDYCEALELRNLPSRSCSFQSRMPQDPYLSDPTHRAGLEELQRQADRPDAMRRLEAAIAEEATRIYQALGQSDSVSEWDITIDLPRPGAPGALDAAYLVSPEGEIRVFGEEAPETRGWSSAYSQTRDVGYVFAPRPHNLAVGLAARRVFRERFSVRLPLAQLASGAVTKSVVKGFQKRLGATGYYSKSDPSDLRPVPVRLQRADMTRRLDSVARRLAGYQGVGSDPASMERGVLSRQRVRDFVSQFVYWFPEDGDKLLDAAVSLVEQILLIEVHAIVDAIERALSQFCKMEDEFAFASIVPFGGPNDSSGIVAYMSKSVSRTYPDVRVRSLPEALDRGTPIVLVDDFIFTGRQGAAIVHAWFGKLGPAKDLNETREVLRDGLQDMLRESKVGLAVVAGDQNGIDRIVRVAGEYCVSVSETYVHIGESDIPRAFVDGRSDASLLQERCAEIGAWLLDGHPKEEQRRLGYGNHSYLLAHIGNTPTQSLTCLWRGRSSDDAVWEPLLPRTTKL